MFERSVLNMQPTPSAIFSMLLEYGSKCFLLSVHVAVWVCMLPQCSIFALSGSLHR